jgi:hypothetical protein
MPRDVAGENVQNFCGQTEHNKTYNVGSVNELERTPDDCCFQWYASDQLPIGTKAYDGRAVQSARGSNECNCHGAGKRDVTGHNSIDDWPGYGNDSRHVFKNEALRRDKYRRDFRNGQNRRRVF